MFTNAIGLDDGHVIQNLVGLVEDFNDLRVNTAIASHTRSHAHLLFANWINQIYQTTPFDPAKERISLSYKQTQPRPWEVAAVKYSVGSIVTGKVVRITTFGAFVELEPGLDGLVHISQCALTRIAKVEDAVSVGDVIRVKVLDVNPEARRISLSIRAVLEEEAFDGLNATAPDEEFAIAPAAAAPVESAPEQPEQPEQPEENA